MDYKTHAPKRGPQVETTLGTKAMEVSAKLRVIAPDNVLSFNLRILDPWRIPKYDIKSASVHDSVEFGEPVEGLMGVSPMPEGLMVLFRVQDNVLAYSVLGGEIAVELLGQMGQA